MAANLKLRQSAHKNKNKEHSVDFYGQSNALYTSFWLDDFCFQSAPHSLIKLKAIEKLIKQYFWLNISI